MTKPVPEMKLTAEQWQAVCDAVDFMAGGDEVCAELWPQLVALDGPVTITLDSEGN